VIEMKKLLTVEELASMLGMTKTSVYQAVYYKRIPCVKISKKALRFSPSDIEAWLESKTQQVSEPEATKTPIRRSPGRPRKNGKARDACINSLVEQAKKEVLG
jgi:excisionase family DNA binding protein